MRSAIPAAALLASIACAAEPAPVRLIGPEIAKLTWDTQCAVPVDLDGDGLLDLALINNENAKLVLLYQRAPGVAAGKNTRRAVSNNRWEPVLEDSRFEKVSLPSDQRHLAMVAADFDGDGRPDLALSGSEDALTVKFQAADGTFAKTWKWKDFEPLPSIRSMQTADFNGDGRADLAVLGKGKLLVFLQKQGGGLGEPTVYLTGEDKAGQLFAEDVDRDGKVDLLYLANGGEGTLRWRRQTAPGVFSAEVSMPFATPAWGAFPSRNSDGKLMFTSVNTKSKIIEQRVLTVDSQVPTGDELLSFTVFNLPGGMKAATYALGDFNGDGLADIAVADSRAAQVALFLQQRDGTLGEPQTFPSFVGITSLAAISAPGEKGALLGVASRKEGLGVSRLRPDGRLEFPASIALKGEPLQLAAVDTRGDGTAALAALIVEDGKWRIDTFGTVDGRAWTVSATRPLPTLKREPTGIAAGDLNGDGRTDLFLLQSKDPALILLGAADGSGPGEPMKETANLRSQLADLSPERAALADIDGDKRAEILTSGTGFARSLKLAPGDADIVVADQFNARQPDNKLATPAFLDTDNDGQPELIFSEADAPFLQVLKKDATGVYRFVRRIGNPSSEVLRLLPIALGTGKTPHLLSLARTRFLTGSFTGPHSRMELAASYDTDLRNCAYFLAVPGDLNGDGRDEIVALDRTSNLLELLAPAAAAGQPWKSLSHFPIFEENIHFRGRKGQTSVREVLIGDFTGDGRQDLLLLVHDRVLLFPQG